MRESVQITLARRPEGRLDRSVFGVESVRVGEPLAGQVLVKNVVFSVDPYMRPRMDDERSYIEPFAVGQPLEGGAVGVVIESRVPTIPEGTTVLHMHGWRELSILPASAVRPLDTGGFPPSYFLGVLGMPGLTAYAGLKLAKLEPGESLFVSSAAGAVGSLAGQLARKMGAGRVVGSVGSDTKADFVTGTLGFDSAVNYRVGPIVDLLAAAAPEGIDAYFDNVGGDHFSAALTHLRDHGRIVVCGTISSYEGADRSVPGNLFEIVRKRLTISGLLVNDHTALAETFRNDVGTWLREGGLVVHETERTGVENAPEAFIGLLQGKFMGKVFVSV
jgi:NADPH-dependent curcumin reductase CurA